MKAVENGNLKVIELLIQKGADLHLENNKGETALMLTANLNG